MPLYEQFLTLDQARRETFVERTADDPALAAAVTPSAVQKRMIVLAALEGGAAAYNLPWAGRIRGPLNLAALAGAYRRLQLRHEQLTRRFLLFDDRLLSLPAAPQEPLPLVYSHISEGPQRDADAARRALADATATFDVLGGPLCRLQVVEYSPDDHLVEFDVHHTVADGWSLKVLYRDFARYYADALAGQETDYSDAFASYEDYVATEHRSATDGTMTAALERVLQRLRGAPASVNLPTDHPRPQVQGFSGATLRRLMTSEAVMALRSLVTTTGRSPFVVGLAAFAETIRRTSGDDDLVIGVPVLGRPSSAFDDVVGMFVNTVPVRVDLTGASTLGASADRTNEVWLATLDDHLVPFDAVVAEAIQDRDPSRSPLFQTSFTYADSGVANSGPWLHGTETVEIDVSSALAKFDLTLTLHDLGTDGLALELEHATPVFETGTAARVLDLFERLLIDTANDPTADPRKGLHLLPGALPHTPAWEREPVRETWPESRTVLDLVVHAARRRPAAIAVSDAKSAFTYDELLAEATSLASRLKALGIKPGDRVGVMLQRTPRLIATLLGVWAAGCSYVPLDPNYPRERLVFMLRDSGCRTVVVDAGVDVSAAVRKQTEVVHLTGPGTVNAALPGKWLADPATAPGHEAYLLYTSGSTGAPKGVSVPHRAVLAMVHSTWQVLGTEPLRHALAATSISFDASNLELYPALSVCGTIHLVDSLLDVPDQGFKPTFTASVPTLLSAALDIGSLDVSELVVGTGGEELPRDLVDRLFAAGAPRVVNLYGPTEDCTYSTAAVVELGEVPPIGKSVPGSHLYVLDGDGFAVAPGAVGEVNLGGAGLADGYAGRPALTADRFVPDPYTSKPGTRVYRTGDLARIRPDGALVYLGRADRQVKVNGLRIELGEVEAALRALPDVKACVVVVQRDAESSRLAAAVVSDRILDPSAVRQGAARGLPRHLVPAVLVQLNDLPRLPNGKTDVAAILDLLPSFGTATETAGSCERTMEPSQYIGEVEAVVRSFWTDLLPNSTADGDFFAEGGTSMVALRLALRLKDKFGVAVTLADVFATRTAKELATLVEAAPGLNERTPASTITDEGLSTPDTPHPLSREQSAIWWLEQVQNVGAGYVIPLGWRVEGPLDVPALSAAVEALQWRHPLLRHRIDTDSNVPATRPHDPIALRLVHDPVAKTVQHRFDTFANEPFDFEGGALLAVELWREGAEEHVLVLKVHHLLVDGWSVSILEQDLSALYAEALTGPAELLASVRHHGAAPAPVPRSEEEIVLAAQRRARELCDAPTILELGSHPRPARRSSAGTSVVVDLDDNAAAALESLCKRFGVTPFATSSLVQALTLMATTGERDVLLGTPVAGRDELAMERVVGMFVTTAVLRIDARRDPTIEQLLTVHARQIAEATREAVPLDALVDAVGPERVPGVNPLFQVLHAYYGGGKEEFDLEHTRVTALSTPGSAVKFDLVVTVDASCARCRLVLEYATDILTEEDMIRYAKRFAQVALASAAHPAHTATQILAAVEVER